MMYSWPDKNCWLKCIPEAPPPRDHSTCWLHPIRSHISTAGTKISCKIHNNLPFLYQPYNLCHPVIGQCTSLMYQSEAFQCDWLQEFPSCLLSPAISPTGTVEVLHRGKKPAESFQNQDPSHPQWQFSLFVAHLCYQIWIASTISKEFYWLDIKAFYFSNFGIAGCCENQVFHTLSMTDAGLNFLFLARQDNFLMHQ